MTNGTSSNKFSYDEISTIVSLANVSFTSNDPTNDNVRETSIRIIQSSVASVGIISNLTVIVVFLNHKKLRRKIPNIFIINQVRTKNIQLVSNGTTLLFCLQQMRFL